MLGVIKNITWTPAIWLLIGSNFIPIFGVLFLGWNVGLIMLLYWLENVMIGVLNIPKILMCQGDNGKGGINSAKLFRTPFFVFHFGMFCFVHFIFLDNFFGNNAPEAYAAITRLDLDLFIRSGLIWAVLSLAFSHIFSMLYNFIGRGEYKRRDTGTQMFIPYKRVIILHVVILIGGVLIQLFGAPLWPLLLLIGLKIGIDMAAHRAEHRDVLVNTPDIVR